MEECGAFNTGYGSVYSIDGGAYLDAGMMDGRVMRAGAVAVVDCVKGAVRLARYVLEIIDHVLMSGLGAKMLAARAGLLAPLHKFYTDEKNRKYLELLEQTHSGLWHYKKVLPATL